MNKESVDVSNQEVTEGDEITCAQPLTQELPPVMAAPGSNITSPALNMAAADRDQVAATVPKKKGKCKHPRPNIGPHPFTMGLSYPLTDHYGYWAGQGQQFQMSYQPQVPFAAGPGMSSWYTPPSVNMDMQGGAGHTPRSHGWWVPNLP